MFGAQLEEAYYMKPFSELGGETALRLFCVSLHPLMTEQENAYIAAALWDAVDRVRD